MNEARRRGPRTELQFRPQDGKPRYAVRSPTSNVAPALSRPLSETMTTISAKSIDDYQATRQDPAPLPFLQEALTTAKFEPSVYEVVRTITPAGEPN